MTESEWMLPRGDPVTDTSSFRTLASRLAPLLRNGEIPYAVFVSASKSSSKEIITFDVCVEVPQDRENDIRPTERISARFSPDETLPPEVLVLRRDFPLVPHLYLCEEEFPRSLCLTEEPWSEERLSWTPTRFVSQVRDWLKQTAVNALHEDDQPLEPIMQAVGTLIVPTGLPLHSDAQRLNVGLVFTTESRQPVLVARLPEDKRPFSDDENVRHVATGLVGKPQTHGIIKRTPKTLADLEELLQRAGVDLCTQLASRLTVWPSDQNLLKRRLIVIAVLPKMRNDAGQAESSDLLAFLVDETVENLGKHLGIWAIQDGNVGRLIEKEKPSITSINGVSVVCLNVIPELSVEGAATMSGRRADSRKCLAIGQGALGSQVVNNLVRSGFGGWTLVDKDMLLPHNLARHALGGSEVCSPKASAMQSFISNTVLDATVSAIDCDVLRPGDKSDQLGQALSEADLILDFSASVAVERYLATDIEATARRVSLFLSSSGHCLVILAEGIVRTLNLHDLEAQFHRLVLKKKSLRDFYRGSVGRLRYGRSCGDLSARIQQERIALHAALAAAAIHDLGDAPSVSVWCLSDDLTIERHQTEAAPCMDWRGKRVESSDRRPDVGVLANPALQKAAGGDRGCPCRHFGHAATRDPRRRWSSSPSGQH